MHPLNGRSQLLFGVPGMVVGTRGARGPVRNLYIFFLQEKWAAFLRLYIRPGNHRGCIGGGLQETHGDYYSCRCNGRKPIGSRSSLLPAASMFSFLSPHASAKASYTAFSFSSIARETTNPNSSPKHAYLPRLHHRDACA